MPFEYKCQSCQAIGDLDSLVDQVECPNCGGMMVPDNAPPVHPTTPDGTDEGETPTTIVPRAEILKEIAATADQPKKVVKVAKFVNIGFGGMLTTSATRGFKPITPGKTDTGLPFSRQSPFSQHPQEYAPTSQKESIPGHLEPAKKQSASSSSTSLGIQKKKMFTVSKFKTSAPPLQQTSTQHMDATQFDTGTAVATQQQKQTAPSAAPVQPQGKHPQAPEEILPKPRIFGPATSTSLKFLPKGALKVAQTHTSIQRSQIPAPPSKLMPQPQQQIPRQYEQPSSNFPDQDEDFVAQVRIEAERREAILREAYRIAEEKIRKEREETEKKSAKEKVIKEEKEAVQAEEHAGIAEHAAKKAAEKHIAQIAKELAETEELIIKEGKTLELRKKELQDIRKSAEEETAKAKSQENKTILLPPQKPVKLKSGDGAESLMRSSKNLQIDKKMIETGKLVLRKEELEMIDSKLGGMAETKKDDADAKKSVFRGFQTSPPLNKKGHQVLPAAKNATGKSVADTVSNEDMEKEKSSAPDIAKDPEKDKTPTKAGINTDAHIKNPTLLKIRKRKKTIILFIVGLAVTIACLLIFFIGGEIIKTIKSSFSPVPVVAPSLPIVTQNLQMEYNAVYRKIKKTPTNRQEIDTNIKELQNFIDSHKNATDTDKYIDDAKTHIKTMQDLKEFY